MKIVIFGGTFNPIHNGHLNIVEAVLNKLCPDKLIIMPTGTPPHKQAQHIVSDEDRLIMLKLAVEELDNVEVCDYEIKKEGKSYTVLTLEHFKKLYPDDELFFVMGSDMLSSFLNWYCPERIMELAKLVCVSRSEEEKQRDKMSAERIASAGGRCIHIDCKAVEASSTQVRELILNGGDTSLLLPKSVEKYICERRLYRNA